MKVQEKKVKPSKADFDEKSVFEALGQAFENALDKSLKPYVKVLRTKVGWQSPTGAFKVEVDARNFGGTKSTYGCDVTVGLINYEIASHDEDRDSFVGDSKEELERDAKNYIRDLFKYAGLKDLQKKVEKASQKNESKNTPKSRRITESRNRS